MSLLEEAPLKRWFKVKDSIPEVSQQLLVLVTASIVLRRNLSRCCKRLAHCHFITAIYCASQYWLFNRAAAALTCADLQQLLTLL
jgi:hypothetical protein